VADLVDLGKIVVTHNALFPKIMKFYQAVKDIIMKPTA
jgi:hypothetical protein